LDLHHLAFVLLGGGFRHRRVGGGGFRHRRVGGGRGAHFRGSGGRRVAKHRGRRGLHQLVNA
jgi:hypothetical protein